MRKRVWVCTWFTCDGKARDGVKAGKDRDLSALDAPAEPAGTAEGPSFTARALSWVLSLLCAAVACVWPPLAVPERPGACPAARSATSLRGNDLEAQLSSADDSGGNKEASINASDIVKGSDEAATPPPAVPSDAALAGSRGGALYCAYLVATFVLTGSATICVWWGGLLTLLVMVVWHLCLLPDLKRWLWRRRVDAQMRTEQVLARAEQAEVDALLANLQVATERVQLLHVVLVAVDATITDLSVTQQAVARHFGLPTGDDCDGATPAKAMQIGEEEAGMRGCRSATAATACHCTGC